MSETRNLTRLGLAFIIVYFALLIISSIFKPPLVNGDIVLFFSGLVLVGLVLGIVGFILMFVDAKSYGEAHKKFTRYSLVIFLLGILVMIVGAVYTAVSLVFQNKTISPTSLIAAANNILILGVVTSFLFLIGGLLLIYTLLDNRGKLVYYAGLGFSVVSSILAIIYFQSFVKTNLGTNITNMTYTQIQNRFAGTGSFMVPDIIGIIGQVLLMLAFFIAYYRVLKRLVKPIPISTAPTPYEYEAPPK